MAYERFIKNLKNNDATFNLLKEKADNSKLEEDKDMLDKYIMSEKEKIIKRYDKKIFFDKSSGQYAVYYKGDDGKRKKFKRKLKEEVEEWIIDKVLEQEKHDNKENLTIATLYPEFVSYMATDHKKGTLRKYETRYNKHFKPDTEFINKPIALITKIELKKWLNKVIGANKNVMERIGYREFCEIRKILIVIFEIAKEEYKIIDENLPELLSFKNVKFKPDEKKQPEEAIYFEEGIRKLLNESLNQYYKHNDSLYLAIIFSAHTAPRVSELGSIAFSDIYFSDTYGGLFLKTQRYVSEDNKIIESNENGKPQTKIVRNGFKLQAGLKSDKPYRDIPIPNAMIPLLLECYEFNKKRGFSSDGFIFTTNGDYSTPPQLESRIETVCLHLNFKRSAYHRLRMTYSSLLDAIGVHHDTRQRILGHTEDKSVTEKHYTFDVKKESERYKPIFDFSLFNNPFDFENYKFDDSDFSNEIQKAIKTCPNVLKKCSNVLKFKDFAS